MNANHPPVSMGPGSRPTRPFPADEYVARIERLRTRLNERKLDVAVVASPVHRVYFTGFQSSQGLLLVFADGRAQLFTDFRYLEAAQSALQFLHVRAWPRKLSAVFTRLRGIRRAGYEGAVVSVRTWQQWRHEWPNLRTWVDLSEDLAALRAVKSPRELAAIRSAVAAADEAFRRLTAELAPGMTEWEIRVRLRHHLDVLSQGESFAVIIAAGPNASRCHHSPTLRRWRAEEPLLIDMGALVDGYHSDLTRVVFARVPSRRWRTIYAAVLEAQEAAIGAIRAGVPCVEVDRAARRVLQRYGWKKEFGHGTGHGVGLEIHESPSLAPRRPRTDRLAADMVVTVEPGVYIPGLGGVRIEDIVRVTERGPEVWTAAPKGLEHAVLGS